MAAQPLETVVLPRVSGRHRDRALASARKCRAIQLKLQGLTYQQIADELGYNSRGTEYKIIKTAQASQLTGAVEEHLDIEVSRLNALQAAVWPAAIAGDLRALPRHPEHLRRPTKPGPEGGAWPGAASAEGTARDQRGPRLRPAELPVTRLPGVAARQLDVSATCQGASRGGPTKARGLVHPLNQRPWAVQLATPPSGVDAIRT